MAQARKLLLLSSLAVLLWCLPSLSSEQLWLARGSQSLASPASRLRPRTSQLFANARTLESLSAAPVEVAGSAKSDRKEEKEPAFEGQRSPGFSQPEAEFAPIGNGRYRVESVDENGPFAGQIEPSQELSFDEIKKLREQKHDQQTTSQDPNIE